MDSEEEEVMRQMKEKMMSKNENKQPEHIKGRLEERTESEFFELIKAKKERIIAHFYHKDFGKCLIMNHNLDKIAYAHPESLFIKINAETSPFLVQKLKIQTLPVIFFFLNGEVKDKVVGFEDIGTE